MRNRLCYRNIFPRLDRMAQTLETMPNWAKDCDALGRNSRYPWSDWFNGDTWLLVEPSADYEHTAEIDDKGRIAQTPRLTDGYDWDYGQGDFDTKARFFRHTVLRAADRYDIDVFCAIHPAEKYEDGRARMVVKAVQADDGLPVHNRRG